MKKLCSKCKEVKNREDFGKCRSRADGLQGWCKSCKRASHLQNREETHKRQRESYQCNKERIKEQSRKWYAKKMRKRQAANFLRVLTDLSGMDLVRFGKTCVSCLEFKPVSRFGWGRDRRVSVCRHCARKSRRDYYHTAEGTEVRKSYNKVNASTISEKKKVYRDKHKEVISTYNKSYRGKNLERIEERRKERRSDPTIKAELARRDKLRREANPEQQRNWCTNYRQSKALHKTYYERIPQADYPGKGGKFLTVHCFKCDKVFKPTVGQVLGRVRALEDKAQGVSNLYCSDVCKRTCTLFKRIKYPADFKPHPRELQGWWAEAVKKRDHYECQRCGSTENLHAHHVEPLATEYDAWLIDNGITFCADCHYGYAHKLDGCTVVELRNSCMP